jgi:hypothetical protein
MVPPSLVSILHNLLNKRLTDTVKLQNPENKRVNFQDLLNAGVMWLLELIEAQSLGCWILSGASSIIRGVSSDFGGLGFFRSTQRLACHSDLKA